MLALLFPKKLNLPQLVWLTIALHPADDEEPGFEQICGAAVLGAYMESPEGVTIGQYRPNVHAAAESMVSQ